MSAAGEPPAPAGPTGADPSAVDLYLAARLLPADPAFDELLRASRAAGLAAADVSPLQGRLLELLARLRGAAAILEVGTLGGYSTLWLARALPPGGRAAAIVSAE